MSFLSPEKIEQAATKFLERHHTENTIPIPIEEIIELKLGIDIVPTQGMMDEVAVDAVTSHDFKQINIDADQFSNVPNRARFSLAHELGHIVLHKSFILKTHFKDEGAWKYFVLNDLHRDPLEVQANMFAAFVLIPTSRLSSEFQKEKKKLASKPDFKGKKLPADSVLAPYLAKSLAKTFEVSEETMSYRVTKWIKNSE
jgi:Zn-dependent peptidase ImmA (M78 family)